MSEPLTRDALRDIITQTIGSEVKILLAEIDRLRAELKALREAAEPLRRFVKSADIGYDNEPAVLIELDRLPQDGELTLGDLRRLAALLPAKEAAR